MAWAIFSMLFLAIGGVVYGAAALIWFALTILANWLMFMKAGEAGWKSIIPVYKIGRASCRERVSSPV